MPDLRAMDEEAIITHQGWDADSLVSLYRGFVAGRNLDDQFLKHLRAQAAEENGGDEAGHLIGPTYWAWVAPADAPVEVSGPYETAAAARAVAESGAHLARLDHHGNYVLVGDPTPPAPALPEGYTGPRYTARFVGEAWVRDNAVACDPQGDEEWDCTVAFLALSDKYRAHLEEEMAEETEALDRDDCLKGDPAAPGWVRGWSGPFSIYVSSDAEDDDGGE